MLFAWSVTEVIRYTFYVLSLLGIDVYLLNWCRYTFFLVLYPLGAGSEAFLSFSTLPPLRTLPYVPKVLGGFHSLLHSMPRAATKAIMKTHPGRALLWSVARARAAKSAGGAWTAIEVVRLVLFGIWWPGELQSGLSRRGDGSLGDGHRYTRPPLTPQASTSSTRTCSSSARSSSPRARPSAAPTRPTRGLLSRKRWLPSKLDGRRSTPRRTLARWLPFPHLPNDCL